jgi:hypothetical protein
MRALLLALIVTTTITGCPTKTETASEQPSKSTASETAKEHKAADDKATDDLEAAKQTVEAGAATVRDKLQGALEASERKLAALKDKAAAASGEVKVRADAAARDVDTRRATLKTDLVKLQAATGAAFDTAKLQVEADAAALDQAIEAFEASLRS